MSNLKNYLKNLSNKGPIKVGCLLVILFFVGIFCFTAISDWVDSSREHKIEKCLSEREFEEARKIANKFDNYDKTRLLKKINSEHLALFINEDDWEGALSLTKEMRCFDAYQVIFKDNLDKLLAAEKFDFIWKTIDTWQFSPNDSYEYDDEVNFYNSVLDIILSYAISTKNKDLAKGALNHYRSFVKYGKEDKSSKESAKQRLKEAKLL